MFRFFAHNWAKIGPNMDMAAPWVPVGGSGPRPPQNFCHGSRGPDFLGYVDNIFALWMYDIGPGNLLANIRKV